MQNGAIHTILFNGSDGIIELPFKAKSFREGQTIMLTGEEEFGHNTVIAEIKKIPACMCASLDEHRLSLVPTDDQCKTAPLSLCNYRIFEKLPGLVDVRVLSIDNATTLYEGDYEFSIPICRFEPVTSFQLENIEKLLADKKAAEARKIAESIALLEQKSEECKEKKYAEKSALEADFQMLKSTEA